MFETPTRSRTGLFWKVMLGVGFAVGAAAVAAITFYESEPEEPAKPLTGILHRGDPDYDWYREHLDLKNTRKRMAKNLAGKRMAIFSGVVENNGEKTLDVVEVKLAFFNYDKHVWDTVRTPIRPGRYTPPIDSLSQRGFTLAVQDIPKGWLATHAEMDIHGFRFK